MIAVTHEPMWPDSINIIDGDVYVGTTAPFDMYWWDDGEGDSSRGLFLVWSNNDSGGIYMKDFLKKGINLNGWNVEASPEQLEYFTAYLNLRI